MIQRVRDASEVLPGTPDLEDGEIPAFWWAAQALERLGEIEQARALAEEARTVAAERDWPHADELETFCRRPGAP
jgi:hypothetical protein